jgi:hypothetical protein
MSSRRSSCEKSNALVYLSMSSVFTNRSASSTRSGNGAGNAYERSLAGSQSTVEGAANRAIIAATRQQRRLLGEGSPAASSAGSWNPQSPPASSAGSRSRSTAASSAGSWSPYRRRSPAASSAGSWSPYRRRSPAASSAGSRRSTAASSAGSRRSTASSAGSRSRSTASSAGSRSRSTASSAGSARAALLRAEVARMNAARIRAEAERRAERRAEVARLNAERRAMNDMFYPTILFTRED